MPDEIALWSAVRQAAAIRDGSLTSRGLLERFIERMERINPELKAIVTFDLERARADADRADAAVAAGEELGPLHGVPITIKDALCTAGIRSTGGAHELMENIPDYDAPVVAAVKAAGAIVFGKTNVPRWSGDIQTFNEMFGTTVNPWDPERVPGGSSGGAAAAVAAGLTSFEIGTDIGGSIRFPSSYCGVYGHKPSFGIVPSTGYLDHEKGGDTEADINVIGPIARSAEDLEPLLELLLRREGPLQAKLRPPPKDVTKLRVAAWLDDPFCPVDKSVLGVLSAAVDSLEASGIAVDRAARPDIDPGAASGLGMIMVGAAGDPAPEEEGAEKSPAQPVLTHKQWQQMHRMREAIREKWATFFEAYDAVLMPVGFVPPFEHQPEGDFFSRTLPCNGESRPYSDIIRWTVLTGMAYLPATVPPVGLTGAGLPIGMQVVGPRGGDYTTIRLAAELGRLCGGYRPPPIA